jgi:hypothetical protein
MDELGTIILSVIGAIIALGAGVGVMNRRKSSSRAVERALESESKVHTEATEKEIAVVDSATEELTETREEIREVNEITDPDVKSDAVSDLLNRDK